MVAARVAIALALLGAAGCVPDLGGYEVVGAGGPLDCDLTRPTLSVVVTGGRALAVEIVELGDVPRPCGRLGDVEPLHEGHAAATFVPGTPLLALASAATWEAVHLGTGRVAVRRASDGLGVGLDGFALFDGARWLAVFPADAGRTATEDVESLFFFDVREPAASRVELPSQIGLGALGATPDCTVDPLDPMAMLCIRGGLSSDPAAAIEVRPFSAGFTPTVRVRGPEGVRFDRISSYPGGRIAWRGRQGSDGPLGYWLGDAEGGELRGPYACPQCAVVGDVVPDPARADGFYLSCADAAGLGIVLRADPTQCAIVHSVGTGTPYDLSLRLP